MFYSLLYQASDDLCCAVKQSCTLLQYLFLVIYRGQLHIFDLLSKLCGCSDVTMMHCEPKIVHDKVEPFSSLHSTPHNTTFLHALTLHQFDTAYALKLNAKNARISFLRIPQSSAEYWGQIYSVARNCHKELALSVHRKGHSPQTRERS